MRRWFLALPLVMALLQTVLYYPQLPEKVASHFDMAGNPTGWSSRAGFFGAFLAVIVVISLLFWGLSLWLHRVPPALLNLPKKDYWLAPERREATYAFVRGQLAWFGFATQWFFIALLQICIEANLARENRLGNGAFWFIFGTYMVFTLAWTVHFFARFLRTGGPR